MTTARHLIMRGNNVQPRDRVPSALSRDTWGAAPVADLEPQPVDQVVTKMRMSA